MGLVCESLGADSRIFRRAEAVNTPAEAFGAKIFSCGESAHLGVAAGEKVRIDDERDAAARRACTRSDSVESPRFIGISASS